jgi:hypothetical protein
MKLWNHIKKAISAVLVLAMVSQTTVVAYGQDNSPAVSAGGGNIQSEVQTSGDPYVQGDILVEVESRREEYTKHFALSDGNLLAVQYGIPVHFKDANGELDAVRQPDGGNHGAAWGSNGCVHGIGIPGHSE